MPSNVSSLPVQPGASTSVRDRVSSEEWEVRVNLAAAYRLAALKRWTDHIYTHFSARVPGSDEHFLINAFGLLFDEISASSLVEVDIDGTIVDDPTGHDLKAVLHTHTRDGIVVSAQKAGCCQSPSTPWLFRARGVSRL